MLNYVSKTADFYLILKVSYLKCYLNMEGENKMFLNQDSSFTLQAQLTDTVTLSQVKISVSYHDNTDTYHSDTIISTNDTNPVVLLDAPSSRIVNIIETIKLYNSDTQANTVQILAGSDVVYTCTIGAKQSLVLSEETTGSTGITANQIGAADTDLSNITDAAKTVLRTTCAAIPTGLEGAIGQTAHIVSDIGAPLVAPSGGTWLILTSYHAVASTGAVYNLGGNVIRGSGEIVYGGDTILAGVPSMIGIGGFWRIA